MSRRHKTASCKHLVESHSGSPIHFAGQRPSTFAAKLAPNRIDLEY